MSIKAIIGLGNIGEEYQRTYHNVGEFAARELAEMAGKDARALKIYPISGFMNESGQPVLKWLKMNNLQLGEIVVAHDDSDLPLGSFKLVRGGGSAGHKGIDSLVAHAGTEDFWRLRIGVRDPAEVVRKKAGEFVLERWSGKDEEQFKDVCSRAFPEIAKL